MALAHNTEISLDGARNVAAVALDVSKALEASLIQVRKTETNEVFVAYRDAVANALMVLLLDIQNPIYAKYPELKPPGWK